MHCFRKFGAYLNTSENVFWTVKWWIWNVIHSVYVTAEIFIIDYRINIIDTRENYFQVIGKPWWNNLKNRIENNFVFYLESVEMTLKGDLLLVVIYHGKNLKW